MNIFNSYTRKKIFLNIIPFFIILIFCLNPLFGNEFANRQSLDYLKMSLNDFMEHFKDQNITNINDNNDIYSQYLNSSYLGLPYTTAYAVTGEYFNQKGRLVFLFNKEQCLLIHYGLLADQQQYDNIALFFKNKYGNPAQQRYDTASKSEEVFWNTGNMQIWLSFSSGSFYKSEKNKRNLRSLLDQALSYTSKNNPNRPDEIWQLLIQKGLIDEKGNILPESKNFETAVNQMSLTELEKEVVKNILMISVYGELNIIYINNPLLKQALKQW
ncbi:MAG: hypothetical protein PHV30_07495 [Candidatus Margulisbacteria bacterium]|nr:hypothetical protein [Candidatus Margulisiibacteriota bacterium]